MYFTIYDTLRFKYIDFKFLVFNFKDISLFFCVSDFFVLINIHFCDKFILLNFQSLAIYHLSCLLC